MRIGGRRYPYLLCFAMLVAWVGVADAEATSHTWRGSGGSAVGSVVYDAHEAIVLDAPFDDHGADLDGFDGSAVERSTRTSDDCIQHPAPFISAAEVSASTCAIPSGRAARMGAAGDYRYPDGVPEHAADMVEVRLAVAEGTTLMRVAFNALPRPDAIGLRVLIDDEYTVEARGTVHDVPTVIDAATATIELRIPASAFTSGAGTHRFFVGAGIVGADRAWLDPSPLAGDPYFDTVSAPADINGYWNDVAQADAIAAGVATRATFDVDFSVLAEDCSIGDCITIKPHASELSVRAHPASSRGARFHPYALYDPHVDPASPAPLVLLLHPRGGNHMSFPLTAMNGIRRWAEDARVLVAMPMTDNDWNEPTADVDVFSIVTDVASTYRVDRSRVFVAGVGAGGLGALRLVHLYPERFAGAIVWALSGCGRGCSDDLRNLFGDALNVPMLVIQGALDVEAQKDAWIDELVAAGQSLTSYRYALTAADTAYPSTTAATIAAWLGQVPPARTPAEVRFTAGSRLHPGLPRDGAYWVRGVEPSAGAEHSVLRATTALDPPSQLAGSSVGTDHLGPYQKRWIAWTSGPARANFLRIEAVGIAEATIVTSEVAWDTSTDATIEVESDAPLMLTISGAFAPGTTVTGASSFDFTPAGLQLRIAPGMSSVHLETVEESA
jgi:hypothetical protein